MQLQVVNTIHCLISVIVRDVALGYEWLFCCGYYPPLRDGKAHFWNLLKSLIDNFDIDWVIVGDFNEVFQ